MHKNHKVLEISDEKALEKENILIEPSIKDFNDKIERTKKLKDKVENEIDKINKLYDEIFQKVTSSFLKKHEILLNKENEMKEKLQNEVTKVKEKLEDYLSELNNIIKYNERINKGIKSLFKENEKNLFKQISYVSKMSQIQEDVKIIFSELMRNIKISFKDAEPESTIIYEDYYFNGIERPKNISFKNITSNSLNVSWEIDNLDAVKDKNNKLKFIVEIREAESKENFLQVYEEYNNNCFIDKLNPNTNYEIKICCVKNEIKNWSETLNFKTQTLFDSIILKESNQGKEFTKKIMEWTGCRDFELLYRGTKDGSKSEIFHNKCDNKGPTVCLYKNEKGNIFGGYASVSWKSRGDFVLAPESFIFTLTNICGIPPTKFYPKSNSKNLFHKGDFGPTFHNDICIYKDFLDSNSHSGFSSFPAMYNDSTGKGKVIFTGNDNKGNNFNIKEIEVFKVIK